MHVSHKGKYALPRSKKRTLPVTFETLLTVPVPYRGKSNPIMFLYLVLVRVPDWKAQKPTWMLFKGNAVERREGFP